MKTTIWTLTACTALAAPATSLWQAQEPEAVLAEIFEQEPAPASTVKVPTAVTQFGLSFATVDDEPAAECTVDDQEPAKEALDRQREYVARLTEVAAAAAARADERSARGEYIKLVEDAEAALADARARFAEAQKRGYTPLHSRYIDAVKELQDAQDAAKSKAADMEKYLAVWQAQGKPQAGGALPERYTKLLEGNLQEWLARQDPGSRPLRALGYVGDDKEPDALEARIARMQAEIAQLRKEREDLVRGLEERERRTAVERELAALGDEERRLKLEGSYEKARQLAARRDAELDALRARAPQADAPQPGRRLPRHTALSPRAESAPPVAARPTVIDGGSGVTVIVEQGDVHIYNNGEGAGEAHGSSWRSAPPSSGTRRVTLESDAAARPSRGSFGVGGTTWRAPRVPSPPSEPAPPKAPRGAEAPSAPAPPGFTPPAIIRFEPPAVPGEAWPPTAVYPLPGELTTPDFPAAEFRFEPAELEVQFTPLDVQLDPAAFEFTTSLDAGTFLPLNVNVADVGVLTKLADPDAEAREPSDEELLREIARMVRELRSEMRSLREDVRGLQGEVREAPRVRRR